MTEPKPSDERNGSFLDKTWCCKLCDGEIPDGHTNDCYIWGLEKRIRELESREAEAWALLTDVRFCGRNGLHDDIDKWLAAMDRKAEHE